MGTIHKEIRIGSILYHWSNFFLIHILVYHVVLFDIYHAITTSACTALGSGHWIESLSTKIYIFLDTSAFWTRGIVKSILPHREGVTHYNATQSRSSLSTVMEKRIEKYGEVELILPRKQLRITGNNRPPQCHYPSVLILTIIYGLWLLHKMVLDPNSTEDPMRDIMRMIESVYNKACNQKELRCDQRPFHIMLMGYGFLVVFLLAMFGNCINLLIYNSDQIRYYIAIRMLCTRLVRNYTIRFRYSTLTQTRRFQLMNTLAMLFLLPQALRTVGAWEVTSAADAVYWGYYPYQAYFVNVFGFCAMW
ncbi:hypothetical protein ANCCEY_08213 [Ancylostoma ceylanicum]|uniref:G-protein coupled receptors family 1 profile domain-containing protein n=1 Tax=Ancylostoma ceylanicum TaxID=53326 RepID=A0A0D6LRN1_9BILA|nr:hypothetical protein ANCCEY_08213 [Ancylostoma ceylanicum]